MAASVAGAKVTEKVAGLIGREGGLIRLRRGYSAGFGGPQDGDKEVDEAGGQEDQAGYGDRWTNQRDWRAVFWETESHYVCFEANRRLRYMKFSLTV